MAIDCLVDSANTLYKPLLSGMVLVWGLLLDASETSSKIENEEDWKFVGAQVGKLLALFTPLAVLGTFFGSIFHVMLNRCWNAERKLFLALQRVC